MNLALTLQRKNAPLPGAVLSMSPWFDMELKNGSIDTNASVDKMLSRDLLRGFSDSMLDGTGIAVTDPRINLAYADPASPTARPVLPRPSGDAGWSSPTRSCDAGCRGGVVTRGAGGHRDRPGRSSRASLFPFLCQAVRQGRCCPDRVRWHCPADPAEV